MGVDEVLEKWDCYPDQIGLIKALSGDSSDNIKGVKGVGKKTAVKICHEMQWLPELIYEHKKIKDHVEKVKQNLELVQLRNCVGVIGPIRWDDYTLGLGMLRDWEQFLSDYELNGLAKACWQNGTTDEASGVKFIGDIGAQQLDVKAKTELFVSDWGRRSVRYYVPNVAKGTEG